MATLPTKKALETRVRVRGYTVPVSPLSTAGDSTGGLLRARWPVSKETYLKAGDTFAARAGRDSRAHSRLVRSAEKGLKARGVDPGPLISGIVSGKFDTATKDQLRKLAHRASYNSSAAFACYAAARLRLSTARGRYSAQRGSGGFYA